MYDVVTEVPNLKIFSEKKNLQIDCNCQKRALFTTDNVLFRINHFYIFKEDSILETGEILK